MFYFPDTIVAPATALAESAVGIIRLSGPDALTIAAKLFRSKKSSDALPVPRRVTIGYLIDPTSQQILDQVLVVWMKAPASYTGEDVVEFHLHGSPVIVSTVLSLAQSLGARPSLAGEFTKRAFLNGKMDLSQAEAVADLIAAQSLPAARNALLQLDGFLESYVAEIRERLKSVLVRLEVGFDFTEEDVSFITPAEVKSELLLIREKLMSLLGTYETGRCLAHGFTIAIVGRPNVGKSSLFNLLLKEERAIVHSQAGTTRDVIEGEILIEGCRVFLMDTAGLRTTSHEIESEGIHRARLKMQSADYLFVVLDGSEPLTEDDKRLLEDTNDHSRLLIINKCDLPQVWEVKKLPQQDKIKESIIISTRSEESSDQLESFLTQKLKENITNNVHNFVLTKERHRFILDRAAQELQNTVQDLEREDIQDDVLSDEIRRITNGLAEIGGQVSSEDVLDQIFKQFCIGK